MDGLNPNQDPQLRPNPLQSCIARFEQAEFYEGLVEWFTLPIELRQQFVAEAVDVGLDGETHYMPHVLIDPGVSDDKKWVLRNFSILTSPCAEKLFDPLNTEAITEEDAHEFAYDNQHRIDGTRFFEIMEARRAIRVDALIAGGLSKVQARRQVPRFSAEATTHEADFTSPNDFLRYNFSDDEFERFLRRAVERGIPTDSRFFDADNFITKDGLHSKFFTKNFDLDLSLLDNS